MRFVRSYKTDAGPKAFPVLNLGGEGDGRQTRAGRGSPSRRRLSGGRDAAGRGAAGAPRSGERRGLGLTLQLGGLRADRSAVS